MENPPVKRRRFEKKGINRLPSLLGAVLYWILWFLLVWFVDPERVVDFGVKDSYALFFLTLFMALYLTAGLFFNKSRRSFLLALWLVGWGFFRLKGIGSIFNFVVMGLLLLSLELFITSGNNRALKEVS